MSARGAGGSGEAPLTVRRSSRITPFWILQAAEILSVLALADLSLHVNRGGVLAVSGGVFAAMALTADGPLGLVRIVGRKLHVVMVVVVAVVVALSPVVSAIRPDIEGIVILEIATIGIIRLATLVNTDPRPVGPSVRRGSRRVVDATATVTGAGRPASAQPEPEPVPALSPSTGRTLFPSEESVGTAARWAGRAAGAATAAASRTAAKHGPIARTQAKRTIRSAGWLVGKATSRPADPTSRER